LSSRDGALLLGRPRHRGIVIRLRRRHASARRGDVILGLVERLLGFEILACQRVDPLELGLDIVEARVGLGDRRFQRIDLLAADAGIDIVAACDRGGERCPRLIRLRG